MKSLVALLGMLTLVGGQVQSTGRFSADRFSKDGERGVSDNAVFVLPALNNAQLRLAAEHERQGPYKFAEAIPMVVDMGRGDGEWVREDGVRKWRAVVKSKGAVSIGLIFSQFRLPSDGEFYVVGQDPVQVFGAYTAAVNNKDDGRFAVQPVPGDSVVLEYIEPAERPEGADQAIIVLERATHAFRAMEAGESGACNIDVACPIGKKYRKQIDSVGVMITDMGQRFCSGVMINNTEGNGAQYFLTASHCVFADQSSFIIGFNYQYTDCRSQGRHAVLKQAQTVHGLKLVAQHNASDFALFLVVEAIPDAYNVFMAGWDIRHTAPKGVCGIHHPAGDAKKISTYTGVCKEASWTEGPLKYHWEVPYWVHGVTEPGSSGSPLYNDRGLVVGHLHGGQSSCDFKTGYDMYGALWADWSAGSGINSISAFLNPSGKPCLALAGKYLREVETRVVPAVNGIMPLYKVPRPRLAMLPGRKDDVAVSEEEAAQLLLQSRFEAKSVEDINDLEPEGQAGDVCGGASQEQQPAANAADAQALRRLHLAEGPRLALENALRQSMNTAGKQLADTSHFPPVVVRNVPVNQLK